MICIYGMECVVSENLFDINFGDGFRIILMLLVFIVLYIEGVFCKYLFV